MRGFWVRKPRYPTQEMHGHWRAAPSPPSAGRAGLQVEAVCAALAAQLGQWMRGLGSSTAQGGALGP